MTAAKSVSLREFARRVGVSEAAIRKAVKVGRLKGFFSHKEGGKPLISDPDAAQKAWTATSRAGANLSANLKPSGSHPGSHPAPIEQAPPTPPAALSEASASQGNGLLTRRELAMACGVHEMTVTKWEKDGLPCAERGGRGRTSLYRLRDVQAWLDQREEAAKNNNPFVDANKARAMKDTAQAKLAEQRFLMINRDLLPRADVERIWSSEIAAVRAKLLAIPQAFADRVARAATIDGIAGVERVLSEAVHEVLRELSDTDRVIADQAESA